MQGSYCQVILQQMHTDPPILNMDDVGKTIPFYINCKAPNFEYQDVTVE